MLRRLRNNTQTLALREIRILKGAVSNFITQRRARSDFAPPSRHREPAATSHLMDTVALGGRPSSSADQPLNCALVTDVKSVKELLPIEVEYKQSYGR